ncbi:unnamed protein product [Malus baccata var. baccata]
MGSGRKGNIPRGFLSPLLCMERHLSVAQKLPVLPVLVCHLSRNLPIPVTSQVFLLIMETVVLSVQLHLLPVLPMIIRYANFSAATSKYCFDGFVALLWVNSLYGVEQVCPICLTNLKDMAFGCGHQTCCECGQDL